MSYSEPSPATHFRPLPLAPALSCGSGIILEVLIKYVMKQNENIVDEVSKKESMLNVSGTEGRDQNVRDVVVRIQYCFQ